MGSGKQKQPFQLALLRWPELNSKSGSASRLFFVFICDVICDVCHTLTVSYRLKLVCVT